MSNEVYDIAVIGGGAAGVMAALRGILNNDSVVFFPGAAKQKKKSRAQWVYKVENMPGFFDYKKGIADPNRDTIKWIESSDFKEKFSHQKNLSVTKIEKENEYFSLEDNKGGSYKSKYVILTTGVMDVQPEIGGSIDPILPYANAQLMDYCIRCDGHHALGKEVVIVGHGDGAVWIGTMLHERYDLPKVTILTNGKEAEFGEETSKLIKLYNFDVEKSPIKDFRGNPKEFEMEGVELEDGTFVKAQFGMVSLGMLVYNELATSLGASVDKRGFVETNEKGESTIPGLYVAGDLRAGVKKQIYTAWDTSVDSADDINMKLRSARRSKLLQEI